VSQALRIGKIRGITLRLHWSWLAAAALLALADSPLLLYLVALMPIVLLHELGHGLVAQRFGLHVLDITFWPLGGFARMSRMPEDGRVAGLVAVAGPAVNLGLALLALPLAFLPDPAGRIAWVFALVNLLLGATNLLPSFPLDGGHVLRALLARRSGWVRATERVVGIGRWIALAMVVGGLLYLNILLALFGFFFWMAGAQELLAVRLRHGLPPFGGMPFGGGRGAAAREDEMRAGEPYSEAPPASGGRRPEESDGAEARPPGAGFSEGDIERLERFPGPLRRLREDP
jgi:Zn-dependent protease